MEVKSFNMIAAKEALARLRSETKQVVSNMKYQALIVTHLS